MSLVKLLTIMLVFAVLVAVGTTIATRRSDHDRVAALPSNAALDASIREGARLEEMDKSVGDYNNLLRLVEESAGRAAEIERGFTRATDGSLYIPPDSLAEMWKYKNERLQKVDEKAKSDARKAFLLLQQLKATAGFAGRYRETVACRGLTEQGHENATQGSGELRYLERR